MSGLSSHHRQKTPTRREAAVRPAHSTASARVSAEPRLAAKRLVLLIGAGPLLHHDGPRLTNAVNLAATLFGARWTVPHSTNVAYVESDPRMTIYTDGQTPHWVVRRSAAVWRGRPSPEASGLRRFVEGVRGACCGWAL